MRPFFIVFSVSVVAVNFACATATSPSVFPDRPMVASLEPIAPPAAPLIMEDEPVLAPGALLQRGLRFYGEENNAAASAAFQAALMTGRLNTAGRALAYWHVSAAEENRGDLDASSEALNGFVLMAEDLIDMRRDPRYADSPAGDFVAQFDIGNKLNRARATLSATWANRNNSFGRSRSVPVMANNEDEVMHFLELAVPCEAHDRIVDHREVFSTQGELLHEFTLSCGADEEKRFFFEVR